MLAPSIESLERYARDAVDALPEPWRTPAREVVLRVEDFPTDEMLESLDIEDAFDLTGLYDGTPMTGKSSLDQPMQPDVIWLFRRPILDEWVERGDVTIGELVAHVMVHELAHHFGWSDDDIARIDHWWE